MFRNSTVARVKARVETALLETCHIERQTVVLGDMNEQKHSREIVQSGVSCRVITIGQQSRSSQTRMVGSQEAMVERYRIICPVGTDFALDDVVVLSDGRAFHVVDVEDGLSNETYASVIAVRQRDA